MRIGEIEMIFSVTVDLSFKSLKFIGIFDYMKLAGFLILSNSIVKINKK